MQQPGREAVSITHDSVPNRIRFRIPAIKHRQTFAELLKQSLLKSVDGKGIYHAEPNIVTGTLLVKFHPALNTAGEVTELVRTLAEGIADGTVEIAAKHKNPRLGKMRPGAFFARELAVSVVGNVLAGLALALVTGRRN
jgi:hypothetical protein